MKNFKYALVLLTSMFLINGCDYFDDDDTDIKSSYNQSDLFTKKEFTTTENSNFYIALDSVPKQVEILDELDGDKFMITDGKLIFKTPPDYENPTDRNKDNIYEVKIYLVDSNYNEYFLWFKIKVVDIQKEVVVLPVDSDGDYIPDSIENLVGKDSNNSDENSNGILDGLEGDNFFSKQWYIYSTGEPMNPSEVAPIEGNDLGLLDVYKNYMGYNGGNPKIIQIVDSGVDINHEDLKDNIDISRCLDGATPGNPEPGGIFEPHGTMLAGISAARAFNNRGVRGVAPFAKIAGSNWLVEQSLDGLEAAWFSGPGANEIAVSNNSWGRYYTIDTIYEDIMQEGAEKLRDGKGRIYVFASGNAREDGADANIQYIINNRYSLVVSAVEYNNKIAAYSTPGANIWVSAYGGSKDFDLGPTIATTYISGESIFTWDSDTNKNYTYAMAGSSAAAPMVSGAVALILEACPNLNWREVKYILATTAKKVDINNPSWIVNGAGYSFSRDYGFGMVNTKLAIDKCLTNFKGLPKEQIAQSSKNLNLDATNSASANLDIDKDLKVEWVEAIVDLDSNSASDFDIYLISPSGTKVKLLQSGTKIGDRFIPNSDWMRGGFRFSTGAMLDELSKGVWQIEVVNSGANEATLKSISLKIYGHEG